MGEPSYKIYDASAGSGKTYTLVRAYLLKILSAPNRKAFRKILAITFTNKAVEELKSRILERLFDFTKDPVPASCKPLFLELQKELGLDESAMRQRAGVVLKEILHNYAFFDVSTIDKFTHRVIRTFARDLNLSFNFDVVVDTDTLLEEGVAMLLDRAGDEPKLSDTLIEFALEKADDEKSWDISFDLKKIGKLIFEEHHYDALEALKGKSLVQFNALKQQLRATINQLEVQMAEKAGSALKTITDSGMEDKAFPHGTLLKHFRSIAGKVLDLSLYGTTLEAQLESGNILNNGYEIPYPEFPAVLLKIFREIKTTFFRYQFLKNAYGNLVPLTLLHSLKKEIDTLLTERNQLPIARFNSLISEEIRDQPTPFIYERLGEQYRHFVIDEFQDTSALQWENLIPLIAHPLSGEDRSGESGSLILVGDAKQAIYRWRGGKAEQFLNLSLGEINPFVISPKLEPLDRNYRSCEQIINFNNTFFALNAAYLEGKYSHLFQQKHIQQSNTRKGGLVAFQFLESKPKNALVPEYCAVVLDTVNRVKNEGYPDKAICVLVRKNEQGQAIAKYLAENGIPITSAESLLLKNNPAVRFLVNLLAYWMNPADRELRFEILSFLAPDEETRPLFYQRYIENIESLFHSQYGFSLDRLVETSVYDGLEYAIKQFKLGNTPSAYLVHFMEEVMKVGAREDNSVSSFLAYWEIKKDKLSIQAPDNLDAITIMTIHKAKGLEFPVVIFPFANSELVDNKSKKLWVPVNPNEFSGFSNLMVSTNKNMVNYPPPANDLYSEEIEKRELDSFNLLYVALTRAIQALYIISDIRKGKTTVRRYTDLFVHYLKGENLWSETQTLYEVGNLPGFHDDGHAGQEVPLSYHYTSKDRPAFKPVTQSGVLWDTTRGKAISKGNFIHYALGLIQTGADLPGVLERLEDQGDCNLEELTEIASRVQEILIHPELQPYFKGGTEVKNESDIIGKNGIILRPDRIWIDGENCAIIEYKTGVRSEEHHHQVNTYAGALEEMGYRVVAKKLVYIGDKLIVETIK